MRLYNVVLGNLTLSPDPWCHMVDEHGNHFISKSDIKQRIRIDNKVDTATYPEIGALTPVWSAANMQYYNILPGTRWVNNNKNMNPLLLTSKDPSSKNEQVVIYLTVSNNYSIIRFNTPHKILQTYHKKDTFQGCAIVLSTDDLDNNTNIMHISAYDKKNNKYFNFKIYFMNEDHSKIIVNRKEITNNEILAPMKEQVAKFNNRFLGFKILTKPTELLTVAYITSDKYKKTVVEATKDINKPIIITVNPDQLEDSKSYEEVSSKLKKEL